MRLLRIWTVTVWGKKPIILFDCSVWWEKNSVSVTADKK